MWVLPQVYSTCLYITQYLSGPGEPLPGLSFFSVKPLCDTILGSESLQIVCRALKSRLVSQAVVIGGRCRPPVVKVG